MSKYITHNPFSSAIKNVRGILDPDQKRQAVLMIILLVLNAIFDFAGLATIGALILSALKGDIFSGDTYIPGPEDETAIISFNNGLRTLYDMSGADHHITFLFYLSIAIFIVFLIKNTISLYIGFVQSKFSYDVSFRLSKKMFRYYYDRGYLFIKDSNSGKKVYSIVDIPMRFASHYLNTLLQLGTELAILVFIAVSLLFINPIAVLLLGVAIVPTFMLLYGFTKNRAKEIGTARNSLSPANYARLLEAMNGYVDVKLGNLEQESMKRYESTQRKINDVDALFFGVYHKLNQRTNDIIFGLGLLVIFGWAHFTGQGTEEVLSLLGLFAIAAYKFLPSINRVLASLMTLKNSSFVIGELRKINNTSLAEFKKVAPLSFEHTLELKDISYSYPNSADQVVVNVNLKILRGETIGIIGSSGSGKTTLLKIILRLLREDNGQILLDGQVISRDLDSAYQKTIGYVEQEIFILNDSIRRNVAFGVDDPDDDKIWESLRDAQLEDFIKSHPEGLDMLLGENGVNLSGGQKQRIGIARALFKQSEILIFDEATSALDSETERAVVESINHLAGIGKTILIVAHRITTLEKCDRIFEMEQGTIIRQPDYDTLIKEKVLIST